MTNVILKLLILLKKASKKKMKAVEAIPEEVKNEAVVERPVEQPDEIVSAPSRTTKT